MTAHTWTPAEIRALGVRTDLVTACSIVYGCGRTKAYELLAAGDLDFPIFRAGNRFSVPTAPLLRLLGLTPDMSVPGPASPGIATNSATKEDSDAPDCTLRSAS
jgi:hypothetical protein